MQIGEMDTRITIKSRSITTGTDASQVPAWSTVATVWAKWVNVHGQEVWAAQAINAIRAATVTIRYRSDVNLTCAILLGSDLYEIVSMDDIRNRHEYIELKVKQVVNG